jgi:hypothetical protein
MYSIVYRAMTGDSLTGYQFSRLALELDRRSGSHLLGPVTFISTWFNQHWHEPVANGIEPSRAAADHALATGDVLYGCFNLAACVVYVATAGRSLDAVIELGRAHYARNGRRVLNAAFHCVHEMQLAKALAGRTVDRLSFTDAEHDEARDVAFILGTDHYNQIGFYLISKLRLHYHYRDYDVALEFAEKAVSLLPAFAGQVGESDLVFFHALTLLAHPASDEDAIALARERVAQVGRWAAACEANFGHKHQLLEGELARVEGRLGDASVLLASAARSASAAGFVQYEALAAELGARVVAASERLPLLQRAADAYRRWGAQAKVADVQEQAGGALRHH